MDPAGGHFGQGSERSEFLSADKGISPGLRCDPDFVSTGVDSLAGLRFSSAAWPWRDRRTVRAGPRMTQERADLVRRARRQDVFELAGLLFDFRLTVHGEAVGEEALGQAVAANDAARFVASA